MLIKAVRFALALSAITTFTTSPVFADDVTDSINEALKYYNEGAYGDAVNSLNYAGQIIQQKKGETLEGYLPEPLAGWTIGETSSQSANAGMFGGGISADREYRKGDAMVTIQVVTDSPLLQGVMMMLTNPMFASSGGGKLERIGKQKGIINFDESTGRGDIKVVADNRFLVTVEGNEVSRDELMQYANALDYVKLATLP